MSKTKRRPNGGQVAAAAPRVEIVELNALRGLKDNPRKHKKRDLEYLEGVLGRVGPARSGVLGDGNEILAGNGFARAAKAAGYKQAIVVDADGTMPVFVRRRNLSKGQRDEIIVADNQANQLSTWDLEILEAYAQRNPALRAAGWTDAEWEALLERPEGEKQGLTDPDDIPKARRTSIKAGDLFELGGHRLLCGSAVVEADVRRVLGDQAPILMVTDPPYGVNYDPTWRAEAGVNRNTKKLGAVTNDDNADWTEAWKLSPALAAYVWHAALKASIVETSLIAAGYALRSQIVWAKDRMALGRGDYHWQHEPCWYAVKDGQSGHRTENRQPTTLWRIPVQRHKRQRTTLWEIEAREDSGHGHSTQKPVECMARAMRYHEAPQVYDPFHGSGTTTIAAEQLGRQAFAIEIEPQYMQIAIDRWEAFTGEKANKVGGR